MKILYHHRINSKDGQYVHIEELIKSLRKHDVDLRVVGPSSTTDVNFGSESTSVAFLKRLLPKFLYELLEFSYTFVDFFRLLLATIHYKPDVIYERYNLFFPSGIWVKRILRKPLILEVNAPVLEERRSYGGLANDRLAKWSQRFVWSNSDIVICVTDVLRGIVADYGVPRDRILVMANGVDKSKFQIDDTTRDELRKKLGIVERTVLGFTGFVRSWHDLEQIADLLKLEKLHDAVLLIVGDGPAIESLREHASATGVADRVIVTGIVDRNLVANYVACFDIALQPNVTEYASPLKVIEYLAMGKAIVAPDVPNIREILRDRYNALLFDPRYSDQLRDSIIELLSNQDLAKCLGSAALSSIDTQGLTWDHNARSVIKVASALSGAPKTEGNNAH